MPKMTAKYAGALTVARQEKLPANGSQDDLYARLQEIGYFWDSARKEWEHHAPEAADPATPLVMIRVWSDAEIVEDVADDVIAGLKRRYDFIERSDPYLCRPPRQREARVYIKFLPKPKKGVSNQ